MALPNQKYLDVNTYVTAEFTSGQNVVPIILVDPDTGEPYIPGGGGAGEGFSGEVNTFADLPSPAIDYDLQYWKVITTTKTGGVFNRVVQDAGTYRSIGGAWEYRGPDIPFYFVDNTLYFEDDVSGNKLGYTLDSFTADRTATWQDKDGTVAYLSDLNQGGDVVKQDYIRVTNSVSEAISIAASGTHLFAFDTVDVNSDTAMYNLSSNEIEILQSGRYEVRFTAGILADASNQRVGGRLKMQLNGVTIQDSLSRDLSSEVNYSRVSSNNIYGGGNEWIYELDLSDGDTLRPLLFNTSSGVRGYDTVPEATYFTIKRIETFFRQELVVEDITADYNLPDATTYEGGILRLSNRSGSTWNIIALGADTIEGSATQNILDGETFDLTVVGTDWRV